VTVVSRGASSFCRDSTDCLSHIVISILRVFSRYIPPRHRYYVIWGSFCQVPAENPHFLGKTPDILSVSIPCQHSSISISPTSQANYPALTPSCSGDYSFSLLSLVLYTSRCLGLLHHDSRTSKRRNIYLRILIVVVSFLFVALLYYLVSYCVHLAAVQFFFLHIFYDGW
jgi:hypothetical protein